MTYVTNTGNVIECDSKSEVKMLEYLEDNDLVLAIGGQNLTIKYSSAFRKNLEYHPDIIALTNEGHIAIIEVKSITSMDYHLNLEKYDALEMYCEDNGFEYMMIDPANEFMTLDELEDLDNAERLDELMWELQDIENENDNPVLLFNDTTVESWYPEYSEYMTRKEFKIAVHACVDKFGWYNVYKNGFMVYSKPIRYNAR